MLTGYNTDFKFQGIIYHVQTEDGGTHSPSITSLLYQQGAILASRKTSYADILKADCLEEVVHQLMMEQHKQMIRDLMHGKIELHTAPREAFSQSTPFRRAAPAPKEAPVAPVKEKEPVKSASTLMPLEINAEEKGKSLDDIILDFLAQEQKEQSQKK